MSEIKDEIILRGLKENNLKNIDRIYISLIFWVVLKKRELIYLSK